MVTTELDESEARYLRHLATAHRVMATLSIGFGALFGLFWGLQAWDGLQGDTAAGRTSAVFELVLIALATAFLWLTAAGHGAVAWWLGKRRRRVACLVLAGASMLNLLCAPVNTVVGLLTIAVLRRPGVKAVFDGRRSRAGGA